MLMSCLLGCKEEMGKLEKAYLKGEYTPFQQENRDALKELPANPLGQLPPPAPSSSQPQKRKQKGNIILLETPDICYVQCFPYICIAGKENEKPKPKKSKGKKGSSIQVVHLLIISTA